MSFFNIILVLIFFFLFSSVYTELAARVKEKKQRVSQMGSAPLAPNALKDAIKAHNYFRGKWR